jgi:phenylpropionate dioxygenase-like ring-hydroxylating dioxygenase large terminal subunit
VRPPSGVVITDTHTNGNGAHPAASDQELESLLATLVERASRPLEEAQGMPAAFYSSEALHELEMERVFRKDWLCVGRAEELPNPGDWRSLDFGGDRVMIVRDGQGEIRAMSQACPHRFMDILAEHEGTWGNSSQGFVCPYHSWAFGLDGKLSGAPLMNQNRLYERERGSYCLRSFAVELWHGFVFINLAPDPEPLAPRLAEIEGLIGQYRLEEWRFVDRVDWPDAPANWKLAMDNGRECYHHQGAHKKTVEPLWPSHLIDSETTESRWWYAQHMHVSPEAATGQEDGHWLNPLVLPPLDGLSPFDRSQYLLVGVYPSMFFAAGPDLLVYATWRPTSANRHKFELSTAVHESQLDNPALKQAIADNHGWLLEVQAEDAMVLGGIQRMVSSSPEWLKGGALSHLERPIWQFQRYMAHRLVGAEL